MQVNRPRSRAGWTVFLTIFALSFASCSEPITHNAELAEKRALEFAEIALVKQDFDGGYAIMSSKAKAYVSLETFKQALSRLHPDGFPATLAAAGVEPMKDERAMYIYLHGENSGKRFQYTLTLNGTAQTGYQVSVVDRTM
jgi:hypothetical protein